ncbi:MAG: class I SAM-dependent methyltransferase [Bacteroidota bacterium]
MTEPAAHTLTYWQYQYDVSFHYMAPLLQGWGVAIRGAETLDVGCGEGGGLCALHDLGARCTGFDVDARRVEAALALRGDRAIEFHHGDMYAPTLPTGSRRYGLVVLHDVFEHLDRKVEMLDRLKTLMVPGAHLLITFPPYYSAYGAHQQHLRTRLARLPFVHLLPGFLKGVLPRLKNEPPYVVEEIRKLGRLKMGMRTFELLAARSGLRIERKQAYLISPNHIRFGLKPLPAGRVARLPLIRELLCSGVVYLLTRE